MALPNGVTIVTRDAAMRCKARARGVSAEDYYSDRPVTSPEKFYSGRTRIDVPGGRMSKPMIVRLLCQSSDSKMCQFSMAPSPP